MLYKYLFCISNKSKLIKLFINAKIKLLVIDYSVKLSCVQFSTKISLNKSKKYSCRYLFNKNKNELLIGLFCIFD